LQSLNSIPPNAPDSLESPGLRHAEDPVWNFFDVAMIAVFTLITSLIVLVGLAIPLAIASHHFRGIAPDKLTENAVIVVPVQTAAYLLVVGFMMQILRVKYHADFAKAIGWNRPALRTALFAVAGGGLLALVSEIVSMLLQKWIPKSLPIDELFRDAQSAYLLSFFGILVAPVVEELFFRGFLYPVLARATGAIAGVLLTAAAFAVVHQGQLAHAWIPLLLIFGVGVALTTVRAKTKSVATTVLMHASYNATIFILVFISTQGFHHLEHAAVR